MGTGIVSVALHLDNRAVASAVLLLLAAIVWVLLAALFCWRLVRDRPRARAEASSPAGLAGVAATAVLATRALYAGSLPLAAALLVLACGLWAAVAVPTLRAARSRGGGGGEAFMVTVAPQSLATLAAMASQHEHSLWLADVAIAFAAVGLLLYVVALAGFDLHALRSGPGAQWVAGGSLAISALAAAEVALAVGKLRSVSDISGQVSDAAFIVWIVAIAWLVVLALSELRWPRLRYSASRWSTVFPLGMYAVCSFTVATAYRTPGLTDFAHVWVWFAVAGWIATLAGMLRSAVRRPRGQA